MNTRPNGSVLVRLAACVCTTVFVLAVAGCGDDSGHADVLECEGTCSCDNDTRTCTCSGGTLCVVEGESDINLICEGNAQCDLQCEEDCHVECPGISGCTADMGDDSSAVCNGSGQCEYTCNGDCTADCPGSSECIVYCLSGFVCEITSCEQDFQDCGNGVLACRTNCPPVD